MHATFTTNLHFKIMALLVVLAAAAGLASLWPAALAYGRQQSERLVVAGNATVGPEAVVNFRLATWLNPAQTAAHLGLARASLATGDTATALQELGRAGQGNDVSRLRLRTYMELGQTQPAVKVADQLVIGAPNTNDMVLACLTYVVANQSASCEAAKPRLSSPEAVQRVARAQASQLTLASELLATGLPLSATSILLKLPESYQRNLLLGHIYFNRGTAVTLVQAASATEAAVRLNTASIEGHQLLAKIYRLQNKAAAATAQDNLVAELISGRP